MLLLDRVAGGVLIAAGIPGGALGDRLAHLRLTGQRRILSRISPHPACLMLEHHVQRRVGVEEADEKQAGPVRGTMRMCRFNSLFSTSRISGGMKSRSIR